MTELVVTLSVIFVTAGVLSIVANQIGVSPIPLYLLAGVITGTLVDGSALLLDLALWGIAFLVFVFGIHVDVGDVQSVLRDAETAAFTQLIVVAPIAFAVGYALCVTFGVVDPLRNAIYFTAAATLSSTIVGSHTLAEDVRNNLVHGRLASSIHFFDDVVAIGVLLVMAVEVLSDPQAVTSQIGYGVLFLLAGLLVYRHGFPLLTRAAGGTNELVLMGSISILIAFIAAAEYVGISIVVGAFAAGIAIRKEGTQALSVQNGIRSIRDFFVVIFFVVLGALVQLPTIETAVLATVLVLLVVFLNPLVHLSSFVYEGYDARTGFVASTSLNQISELSLVIAIQALVLGTIADELFDAIVLAAAASMLLSALTQRHEEFLFDTTVRRLFGARQTRHVDEHSHVAEDLTEHVVVIGYGRLGRRLVDRLEAIETPYVVLENDPVLYNDLRSDCRNYVFGDATATYPMERAGVADASLIVSTVNDPTVSTSLLERDTDADRILRSNASRDAAELLEGGATYVTVPGVLAADELVETVRRIVDGEIDPEALRTEHRDRLEANERAGGSSRF